MIFCFCLYSFGCHAQENDILTARNRMEGVYLTFDEFRKNSPSLPGKVEITNHYVMIFDSVSKSYKKIGKSYWGACLNDSVYIYVPQSKTSSAPNMFALETIDRYCFFSGKSSLEAGLEIEPSDRANPALNYSDRLDVGASRHSEFVVNINNGNTYQLTIKLMRIILEKDTELKHAFENEQNQKKVFRKYILEYNKRHQDDIKPLK